MKLLARYRTRRRVKIAVGVIVQVDKMLVALHSNHAFRKQIWGDFIKNQSGRDAIVRLLMKGKSRQDDLGRAGLRQEGSRMGSPQVVDSQSIKPPKSGGSGGQS